MYKIIQSITGHTSGVSYQLGNILYSIPFSPDNTDYQAYLAWLEEGNEPLPPDNNQ